LTDSTEMASWQLGAQGFLYGKEVSMYPLETNAAESGRAEAGHLCWVRRAIAPTAVLVVALLASLSLLTSCGQMTPGGQRVQSGSPSASSTPASRLAGAASYNGCPAQHPPVDAASFRPDVVVSQENVSSPQMIALTQGQRIEIRLQPMYRWQLTASDSSHALAASSNPEGWYDDSLKACIWRFTAAATGSAQLSYSGPIVCPPLELCPSDEQSLTYDVTVR
jgi:hypothetical protein